MIVCMTNLRFSTCTVFWNANGW